MPTPPPTPQNAKSHFRTEPIELDPAHIARIDQAIKGY